jgi:hypothetical protein
MAFVLTLLTAGHSVNFPKSRLLRSHRQSPCFPVKYSSIPDYSKNVLVVDDPTKHPILHAVPTVRVLSRKPQDENFFRDSSQENALSSGLGLGMHIVAQILTLMGGKIQANSTIAGSEARVSVVVPLNSDESSSALAASADRAFPKP